MEKKGVMKNVYEEMQFLDSFISIPQYLENLAQRKIYIPRLSIQYAKNSITI